LDSLVLGSSNTNKAFIKSPQDRFWTTLIETISANGKFLKPAIIFKGRELQSQWFIQEFNHVADWHVICSENG
jgi:hypothetical protein